MSDHRPGRTMVGLAPTRLPPTVRPRLTKLAQRGAAVCRKHGAKLLAEICVALEIALLDLMVAEQRASAAERRTQTALSELGGAKARIQELEEFIEQREYQFASPTEFTEPTAVRDNPALLERCKNAP